MDISRDVSEIDLMTIGYRNRTILVTSICFPLAVLSVALRFTSRVLAKNPFWWDDWFALAGLFMTGAFCVCMLVVLPSVGLIEGTEPITTALETKTAIAAYTAELIYYCNQLFLKSSILMFYYRIFGQSNYMRLSIYGIGVYISLLFVASFLVSVLQCIPVQASWDPVAKLDPNLQCVDLNGFFFGTSVPNIIADFVLVVLPIPQVLKLKITTAQKIFVIVFFILGGFVVITSIVRLKLILTVNFVTFTVNFAHVNAVLWTSIENCCGVISVCLPSLRPIIRFIPWKSFQNAFVRSTQDSNSQSKQSTRMEGKLFGRSRQRSQWSQIESSNEVQPDVPTGIRKQTEIEVNSIEMGSLSNSSQVHLAGVTGDSKH